MPKLRPDKQKFSWLDQFHVHQTFKNAPLLWGRDEGVRVKLYFSHSVRFPIKIGTNSPKAETAIVISGVKPTAAPSPPPPIQGLNRTLHWLDRVLSSFAELVLFRSAASFWISFGSNYSICPSFFLISLTRSVKSQNKISRLRQNCPVCCNYVPIQTTCYHSVISYDHKFVRN